MTHGAIQSSYTSKNVHPAGELEGRERCDIDSTKMVYATDGIGVSLVVSRRTDYEDSQVIPGGTNVCGITVRDGATTGAETDGDNTPIFKHQKQCRFLKSGIMYIKTTGTGLAGSRTFNYNTTTGAIDLGAPGVGEAALYGLTLEENVTVSGAVAKVRVDDVRSASIFVTDVEVNGTSVVTAGLAEVAAVTSIEANGGTPLVGDIHLTNSDTAELTQTDGTNTIDIGDV